MARRGGRVTSSPPRSTRTRRGGGGQGAGGTGWGVCGGRCWGARRPPHAVRAAYAGVEVHTHLPKSGAISAARAAHALLSIPAPRGRARSPVCAPLERERAPPTSAASPSHNPRPPAPPAPPPASGPHTRAETSLQVRGARRSLGQGSGEAPGGALGHGGRSSSTLCAPARAFRRRPRCATASLSAAGEGGGWRGGPAGAASGCKGRLCARRHTPPAPPPPRLLAPFQPTKGASGGVCGAGGGRRAFPAAGRSPLPTRRRRRRASLRDSDTHATQLHPHPLTPPPRPAHPPAGRSERVDRAAAASGELLGVRQL